MLAARARCDVLEDRQPQVLAKDTVLLQAHNLPVRERGRLVGQRVGSLPAARGRRANLHVELIINKLAEHDRVDAGAQAFEHRRAAQLPEPQKPVALELTPLLWG